MQMRLSLSLLSGAVLLATPLLAGARVIDGFVPPTTRGAEQSVIDRESSRNSSSSSSSSSVTGTDTGESVDSEEVMDMLNGMDKGGYGYYPPMPGNGVSVDVSVTKTVTPDFVAINAYCEVGPFSSRTDVKTALTKVYNDVKTAVGSNGKVRKNGSAGVYPYYDPTRGTQTSDYNGSLSIFVKIENLSAAQSVSDAVENQNCTVSWDVRLVDTQEHEFDVLDELIGKLNKRKAVFEKLLKRQLDTITGASMSTWVDGYSTYDPDTNTADATTSLSVYFDGSSN